MISAQYTKFWLEKHKVISKICIYIFSALVMISRRPDALVRAQFFAEDGFLWFAQAYNNGVIQPFFEPVAGYFQTLARIAGLLAQFVPLQYAPLVMNGVALLVQLLPIVLLFSARFEKLLPSLPLKFFILLSYLLLFNIQETHLNVTNAQWYLAVVALLVLLVPAANSSFWRWFDIVVVSLSGLSGPFAMMLYPVAVVLHQFEKTSRMLLLTTIVSVTASIQFISVIFSGRGGGTLISWTNLPEIFTGLYTVFHKQVVWGLLSGQVGFDWITQQLPLGDLLTSLISVLTLFLILYAFVYSLLPVRLFILFASIIFFTSTVFPTIVVPAGKTSWDVLEQAYGIRYWLVPILSLLIVVVWSLKKTNPKLIRAFGFCLLLLMIMFWLKLYRFKAYYQFTPLEDFKYHSQLEVFSQQPIGTEFIIHHPPRPWSMRLTKK